jgi:glycosyltransferase involved in cell wall biosynthesis
MMHVLVVSPHLPPSHVGGVEVYSQYLMRAYRARGHRVQGVAVDHISSGPAAACAAATDDSDGYPAHRLTLTLPRGEAFPLLADHAPAQAWFESLIAHTAPDVVHVQSGYLLGAPALAAAARTGTPAVLTLHDYWFACPRVTLRHPSGEICSGPERPSKCAWCLSADQRRHGLLDAVTGGALSRGRDTSLVWRALVGGPEAAVVARRAALGQRLRSAAAVLAPTRFVAAQVAAGTGYPLDAIRLSRYGMPPIARVRRTPGPTLRLAFIGQLAPHKGVHLVIEAVRSLADRPIALDVHGPLTPYPDYVARLKALAGDDPRIVFRGPYRREALAEVFAATDIVVVPSVWHEVAAIVIQEAQAAGLPVMASTLGGSPELIRDGVDGLLFDPADPGHLTRQIARLLDEPGLRARLDAAAPQPRTIDDEVDALLALYASVRRAS